MPKRIKARWSRHHNLPKQDRYTYDIAPALKKAKIDTDEFNICWSYLNAKLSSDELFSLFYFGFSPRDPDVPGRLAFVRTVLKRYKDAKVFSGFYQYVFLYAFALFTIRTFVFYRVSHQSRLPHDRGRRLTKHI